MLEVNDYLSMVQDGVPRNMVALVESAFNCIFEAKSTLTPLTQPWNEMASDLGIDLSDCVKEDGTPNRKMIAKKFNENDTYKGIIHFVDTVLIKGKEMSGVSEYPDVLNSPDFNTFMNNQKVNLIANCVRVAASSKHRWWEDPGFTEYFASKAASVIDDVLVGSTSENEFQMDVPSYSEADKLSYDENTYDDLYEVGHAAKPLFTTSNGCSWYKSADADGRNIISGYVSAQNQRSFASIVTENEKLLSISPLDPVSRVTTKALAELLGNVHFVIANPDGIIMDNEDHNLDPLIDFVTNITANELVQIYRKNTELYNVFIKNADELSSKSPVRNTLYIVKFMTEAYDRGIADAEDLEEMCAESYQTSNIDPQLQLLALRMFGNLRTFHESLSGRSSSSMKSIVAAVVGKNSNGPEISLDPDDEHVLDSMNQLRHAKSTTVQYNDLLLKLSNMSRKYNRYMPLCEEVLHYLFKSGNINTDKIQQTLVYFIRCVEQLPARGNTELYRTIRKYVTPRIQTACIERGWTYTIPPRELFFRLSTLVPGFNVCDDARSEYTSISPSTPKACIRDMITALNSDSLDSVAYGRLIYELTSKNILEDLHTMQNGKISSYTGQRIKDLSEDLLKKYPHIVTIAHQDEMRQRLPLFLANYILPNDDILINFNIFRLGEITEMITGAIELYIKDPQLGEKAYLDDNGIFKHSRDTTKDEVFFAFSLTDAFRNRDSLDYQDKFSNIWARFVSRFAAGQQLLTKALNLNAQPATCALWMAKLISLSSDYEIVLKSQADNDDALTFDNSTQAIISDDEFATMLQDYPVIALMVLPKLKQREWIRKICEKYFNDKFLTGLCRTTEGIELFLQMSHWANWEGFTTNFIRTHASLIKKTLNDIADKEPSLVKHWNDLLASINVDTSKHAAQRSSVLSNTSGRTVDCSLVNGLNWSRNILNVPGKGIPGLNGSTLYDIGDAEKIAEAVRVDGWRLPTLDELDILGGDPAAIRDNQIGFKNTGMAVTATRRSPTAATAFFGWATDEDGNYAVYTVSGNIVDTMPDIDDPADVMAAIKLVHD